MEIRRYRSEDVEEVVRLFRDTVHTVNAADYAAEHKGGLGQNVVSTNAEIEIIENDILNALYYDELTPEAAADEFIKLMTEKVAELKENFES